MAKKINIAELDILTDKFLKKAFEVKKRIEEIRIEQKDLEKDSPKFTKNTADLKRLNAEYNKHLKASNALLAPYDKLVYQFKQASERARNLAAQYGVNSKQAKRAAIEAGALRKKIEEIKVASSTTTGGLTKLGTSIKNAFSRFVGFTLISTAIFGFISALRNAIRVVVEYDRQLIAVGKTTNLSRKETRELGQEFINLGLSLKGISIQNLLKSAEIAGQLGIRGSENIKKFSETIERLALTSDIAGEESARNFAKFIQVSSDTIENADRLGSVITDLGNNFATTEKQILESATDIQGALVAYNVSAKGVLALASATSSLGLSSELSRSGIQRIFKVLNEGINTGKNLNEILRITGLTQEEISKQFEDDSLVVFDKFVNGLKNVSEGGENLSLILKDLGLNEKRTEIVTSVLAKRTNVLNDAIKRSSDEYANNKA
jgi:TP901 family phage tail tape measure protein